MASTHIASVALEPIPIDIVSTSNEGIMIAVSVIGTVGSLIAAIAAWLAAKTARQAAEAAGVGAEASLESARATATLAQLELDGRSVGLIPHLVKSLHEARGHFDLFAAQYDPRIMSPGVYTQGAVGLTRSLEEVAYFFALLRDDEAARTFSRLSAAIDEVSIEGSPGIPLSDKSEALHVPLFQAPWLNRLHPEDRIRETLWEVLDVPRAPGDQSTIRDVAVKLEDLQLMNRGESIPNAPWQSYFGFGVWHLLHNYARQRVDASLQSLHRAEP